MGLPKKWNPAGAAELLRSARRPAAFGKGAAAAGRRELLASALRDVPWRAALGSEEALAEPDEATAREDAAGEPAAERLGEALERAGVLEAFDFAPLWEVDLAFGLAAASARLAAFDFAEAFPLGATLGLAAEEALGRGAAALLAERAGTASAPPGELP